MENKIKIENFDDLRDVCTNTISGLVTGVTTPANANAIFNGVGKIISTVKAEVERSKVIGKFRGPLPLKVAQMEQFENDEIEKNKTQEEKALKERK